MEGSGPQVDAYDAGTVKPCLGHRGDPNLVRNGEWVGGARGRLVKEGNRSGECTG